MRRAAAAVPTEYSDAGQHRKILAEAVRELAAEMPVVGAGSWDESHSQATTASWASVTSWPKLIGSTRPRILSAVAQLRIIVTSAGGTYFRARFYLDGAPIGRIAEWHLGAKATDDTITIPLVSPAILIDKGQHSLGLQISHVGAAGYTLSKLVVKYDLSRAPDRS